MLLLLRHFSSFFVSNSERWKCQTLQKFDSLVSSLTVSYRAADEKQIVISSINFDSTYSRQALMESLEAALLRAREKQQSDLVKVIGNLASNRLGDLAVLLSVKGNIWISLNVKWNI